MAIGAITSGIGAGIKNGQAARQQLAIVQARNNELRQTMTANRQLAEESRGMFDNRVDSMTGDAGAAAEQKSMDDRQALMDRAVEAPAPDAASVAGSAPSVVKSELAKKMLEAFTSARDEAGAAGRLGGHGDFWFNQGTENAATGRNLGVNLNLASGNLGLLPHLQDLAEVQATKPIGPLGDILMGIGSAVGSAGGSGMFGRAAGAAANPGVFSGIRNSFYSGVPT